MHRRRLGAIGARPASGDRRAPTAAARGATGGARAKGRWPLLSGRDSEFVGLLVAALLAKQKTAQCADELLRFVPCARNLQCDRTPCGSRFVAEHQIHTAARPLFGVPRVKSSRSAPRRHRGQRAAGRREKGRFAMAAAVVGCERVVVARCCHSYAREAKLERMVVREIDGSVRWFSMRLLRLRAVASRSE